MVLSSARLWLVRAAAAASALVPPGLAAADPARPSIVYILADDFGYGDAACYNPAARIPTPHIDRLAAEGLRFTDAHSGSAVCSPTRYGLLTGRYAWRTHLRRAVLVPYDPPLITPGRLTVPALLRQHGYRTVAIGKWHLGWDWPRRDGDPVFDQPIGGGPTTRGFERYFGPDVPNYPPYVFIENDRTVGLPTAQRTERNLDGRPGPMLPGWRFDAILPELTRQAVAAIDDHPQAAGPLFLYFALTSPHEPVAPSARFKGRSGISDLADFLMETDWAVGEILAALDRGGLAKDTLLVFTTDNGHGRATGLAPLLATGHLPGGPWRGYKGDIHEGGHRVPFIARWSGRTPAGAVSTATICHTHLLATCAELLGATLPPDAGEDSFSILPLLRGELNTTS